VSQTYEQLGGRQLFRARTGKARLQSHWSKVKTVCPAAAGMSCRLRALIRLPSIPWTA
jgi:hypothetical protein